MRAGALMICNAAAAEAQRDAHVDATARLLPSPIIFAAAFRLIEFHLCHRFSFRC